MNIFSFIFTVRQWVKNQYKRSIFQFFLVLTLILTIETSLIINSSGQEFLFFRLYEEINEGGYDFSIGIDNFTTNGKPSHSRIQEITKDIVGKNGIDITSCSKQKLATLTGLIRTENDTFSNYSYQPSIFPLYLIGISPDTIKNGDNHSILSHNILEMNNGCIDELEIFYSSGKAVINFTEVTQIMDFDLFWTKFAGRELTHYTITPETSHFLITTIENFDNLLNKTSMDYYEEFFLFNFSLNMLRSKDLDFLSMLVNRIEIQLQEELFRQSFRTFRFSNAVYNTINQIKENLDFLNNLINFFLPSFIFIFIITSIYSYSKINKGKHKVINIFIENEVSKKAFVSIQIIYTLLLFILGYFLLFINDSFLDFLLKRNFNVNNSAQGASVPFIVSSIVLFLCSLTFFAIESLSYNYSNNNEKGVSALRRDRIFEVIKSIEGTIFIFIITGFFFYLFSILVTLYNQRIILSISSISTCIFALASINIFIKLISILIQKGMRMKQRNSPRIFLLACLQKLNVSSKSIMVLIVFSLTLTTVFGILIYTKPDYDEIEAKYLDGADYSVKNIPLSSYYSKANETHELDKNKSVLSLFKLSYNDYYNSKRFKFSVYALNQNDSEKFLRIFPFSNIDFGSLNNIDNIFEGNFAYIWEKNLNSLNKKIGSDFLLPIPNEAQIKDSHFFLSINKSFKLFPTINLRKQNPEQNIIIFIDFKTLQQAFSGNFLNNSVRVDLFFNRNQDVPESLSNEALERFHNKTQWNILDNYELFRSPVREQVINIQLLGFQVIISFIFFSLIYLFYIQQIIAIKELEGIKKVIYALGGRYKSFNTLRTTDSIYQFFGIFFTTVIFSILFLPLMTNLLIPNSVIPITYHIPIQFFCLFFIISGCLYIFIHYYVSYRSYNIE